MDAVIMNMDMRVEDFIRVSKESVNPQIAEQDFIMTGDWNGPNTGIWIAKVSPFTKWFFKTAWDVGEYLASHDTSPEGIFYPFEYEQRVFHYLLNTEVWQDRKLPPYQPKPTVSATEGENNNSDANKIYTSEEIRTHFAFLPQCSFNSYSIHPFFWKGNLNKEKSQYIKGDFLIHFAGKKGTMKQNIIKHYLDLAKKTSSPIQVDSVATTSE